MTAEDLRAALAAPMTLDRFRQLAAALRGRAADEVFGLLWPLALDTDLAPADAWASCLLVELEPWCPLSVEDALRAIGASRLNLSNRLVPLYLASQFGKRKVGKAYRALVPPEFSGEVPPELSGIMYWLGAPAVELAGWFCNWRREG
ncbi:hypothetical protein [Tuwongella immobilis]|uniref:Uncharacterized protein n=1 Tax=Tuwongella immobilis TaxID=692036 RepID=A0A6C2YRR9_9BACT|nr:hypothetical protein [Tuwongella immobilis]VIP04360.1 Uncharacterized protein OS=Methylomonas methanica (strain MC09) GN=Metme_2981 PE=4 SV=1 [Tuwongella immobilis]VTS06082.1 Uncharacterized protein OS=Methylomonas methanica (strain MC09) GN=Metme_2981 PE=4 SV=1 [Tuwongella immobilis]